jgi:NAD(P)-dependent dehydrogenase (short-subunit alcohol dehydrogenase family)
VFNPLNLSGRTILVTGASSGIGRETCRVLDKLGAKLIMAARDKARLDQTGDLLSNAGHRAELFDLSAVDEIPTWLQRVAAESGPLHGFVHSAGLHLARPVRFLTSNDVEKIMRINVFAALALTKAFRQKGVYTTNSSIVFISSVMGLVGQKGVSAYSATKGALISLARSLALELAGDRIRVNCVAPGQVKTEMADRMNSILSQDKFAAIEAMHPLGLGTAQDVANAIAFLLSDAASWITGTTLVVDGGYSAA